LIPGLLFFLSEPGVYFVDALLKERRTKGGKKEYLVKWKGCGPDDNTWEPASNVTLDLIDEFESRKGAK
jgi:hypothetical protein